MDVTFTAVYVEGDDDWIVAYAAEFPNVVTQGKTIAEARGMVLDAVSAVVRAHRTVTEKRIAARHVVARESLTSTDILSGDVRPCSAVVTTSASN